MSYLTRAGSFAAILLAVSALLPAQVLNGRIEVVVQDQSGAAVVGAKVSLRDLRKRSPFGEMQTTNENGTTLFVAVPPSEYEINIESAGFRKANVPGLELNASQQLRQLVALEVGAVTESVTVEANVVQINSADATIARTINLKAIDTLPALGRNPLALINNAPGVSTNSGDTSFGFVNGLRQGSNNTRLDGIDANDAVVPRLGLSLTSVNTDSLEEVRIITNGGKAEYGRNAGGQVEMVTRSGSNDFHGNAFDYLRNTVLNANNWFNNSSGTRRPVFIQNIFGGSLGGRILKDKLFFYGNYQGRKTIQGTIRNRTVLTSDARAGIFRTASTSYNIPANDPAGRGIDPQAAALIKLTPLPNNTDVGDGFNTGGYRFNASTPQVEHQGTGKVDYSMTANHRLFFRYSRQFNESIDGLNNAEQRYPGLPDGAQGGTRYGYAVGSDWTLSPSLINEFRIGYQSATVDFIRPYRDGGIAVTSVIYTDPINNGLAQGRNSPVIDMTDNFTMLRGKHVFKVGGSFRRVLQHGYNLAGAYPNVTLSRTQPGNGVPTTIGPTGLTSAQRQIFDDLYNAVLGRVGQITQTFYSDLTKFQDSGTGRVRNTIFRDLGFFFQDDWKLTKHLTLNVGVRWEYFGSPTERDGFQGSFDKISQVNPAAQISDLKVTKNSSWFNADKNNLAPRFGFAYAPFANNKTVFRGNFGIFFDRVIGATSNVVDGATPGFSFPGQAFPNSPNGNFKTLSTLTAADFVQKPAAPVLQNPTDRLINATVFNPNLRTGYVQQVNFGVQQQLTKNTVMDATFVRTKSTKLFTWQNLNQPRIYGDYLNAFKELATFQAGGAAPAAGNTLVRMFGSPAAAVTGVGAANLSQGLAGSAASNIDITRYSLYPNAGLSPFYLRPFPQYDQLVYGDNAGSSNYNSLQVTISHRGRNSSLGTNYTFSKSIDNGSLDGNGFTQPVDNLNLGLNRGRSDFDRTHVLNFTASYNLPFGRGQRFFSGANGLVNRLVGGWEIGTLGIIQKGTVFSVVTGRNTANSGFNSYANYSGDRTIGNIVKDGRGVEFFTAAQAAQFTFPGAGEVGSSGRNSFRGPGFFNQDASLVKRFAITEKWKLSYRAEAYNMWNNAMFANPGTNIVTTATFGRSSATASAARIMQMALRLDF